MRYFVRAKFRDDQKRKELLKLLTDGTVEDMDPFGREVAAAMRRAVRIEGEIAWTETCYCFSPLMQERAAVYDNFSKTFEPKQSRTFQSFRGSASGIGLREIRTGESQTTVRLSDYVPFS